LAKIAVNSDASVAPLTRSENSRRPQGRKLAQGEGWSVSEVVCTLGPRDKRFEERHSSTAIAVVMEGTFQYRSGAGGELMTPGSLFLGNAGQCFECGHEHGIGDRCISFAYEPEFFARLASDAGSRSHTCGFKAVRVPPIRTLSALVAAISSAASGASGVAWDDLSVQLAARAVQLDRGLTLGSGAEPAAVSRVTRVVRMVEATGEASHDLRSLAREARLSPYHFLRTFQSVTGVTPHQYILRMRLRRAAALLSQKATKIVDIALECGFGDISNFNRNFRAEFGVSPRAYRERTYRGPSRSSTRKPFVAVWFAG
jgi:AraC family transcriptional regulator